MAGRGRPAAVPTVHISSYTKGGRMQSEKFAKVSDLLEEYQVDMTSAVIEVTSEDGEERRVTAASKLQEGDTVIIMKSKNKSGS